ncbi:beta/gamma crystallin domain-containing protein [Variovorax paradoxus]|uniref:beta/gamma crystallin domain-containing protein n=1 Tax=Variovorax paradoxus TaxID=34073 RepID=UPI0029C7779E|nr:beta/gamma crystallin domain-containing protein [Variovorax paradoxus]
MKNFRYLMIAGAMALGACSHMPGPTRSASPTASADNRPDPTILLVPVRIEDPALASGCWAQFYTGRNFQGDMLTLVGPAEVQSMDRGTARQLKRDIDSVSVGPRATLKVYEHAMFRDRTVDFPANSREGGLMRKLGFGGRIEAMKLDCA